jgi:hypothetical protein
MHPNDLNNKKDILKCTFCRNPLQNMDIDIKKVEGDFVSVACDDCKNKEPKFLICCCSDEPRELSVEMAKTEIALSNPKVQMIDFSDCACNETKDNEIQKRENDKPYETVSSNKPKRKDKEKRYL